MVATRTNKDDKDAPLTLRVMNTGQAAGQSVEHSPLPDQTATDDLVLEQSRPANPKPANRRPTNSKPSNAKPSNKKNKSKNKPVPKSTQGTFDLSKGSRGIDTLLRNAYRSQLDMLALAATKANIMISLNGLLMSMLIISGTHLVSINGMYIIPIALFLVTCAVATTFAVFAARPEIGRNQYNLGDFMRDEARLMVFEEFSDLRESEYIEAMTHMLEDPKRVYRSMLAHIHDLGVTADRKYRHLYYSYTTFMAGTILTVLSLLILVGLKWSGLLLLA